MFILEVIQLKSVSNLSEASTVRTPKHLKKIWKKWLLEADLSIQDYHILVVEWSTSISPEEFFSIVKKKQ